MLTNLVDLVKMLKNALTLAIGGVDTAENGRSKFRQVTNKIRLNIGGVRLAPEQELEAGVGRRPVLVQAPPPRGDASGVLQHARALPRHHELVALRDNRLAAA